MFGRDGHPAPLGQAFIEYGRIAKTLHLLALVDPVDGSYQRRMNRQLTVQESRHRLGRKICHGHRGQIRQAYREGQEDQLAALGLVLSAVVLWNTRYLDAIAESLRGSGQPVRDEAAARLSPLGHAHLNCLGRYAFTTQPPAELRPLRDPNARDGADDGEFRRRPQGHPGAGRVICHGRPGRMSPGLVMAGTGGSPGSPRCWTYEPGFIPGRD
jgi:hypothetical protein